MAAAGERWTGERGVRVPGGEAGRRVLPRWLAVLWPLLALALLCVLVASTFEGWVLTHPPRRPVVGDPATEAYLPYRCLPQVELAFSCTETLHVPGTRTPISGWILPSVPSRYPSSSGNWSQNTVIFVPDHGQSRTPTSFPVWGVATVLNAMGYNVVLYDPEAMGRSGGAQIGFGTFEVRDLQTVVHAIQNLGPPQGHIAVWGLGTGADTAILAAAANPAITAVIADSPYLTPQSFLRRAIPRWTGWPAALFSRTILWAMQRETGVNYAAYDPLRAIPRLGGASPRALLLVSGSADTLTPPATAHRLFAASHDARAQWLQIMGAHHLRTFADSPPSGSVPGINLYLCDALNTLKAMQTGETPAAEQRVSACGGAAHVLEARNAPRLPASVAGVGAAIGGTPAAPAPIEAGGTPRAGASPRAAASATGGG